jgi:hypothetical protein
MIPKAPFACDLTAEEELSLFEGLKPSTSLTCHQLHYDPRTECGVLFHLIGAVSEYGKLGLTAIANSHDEAEALYGSTLAVLDSETTYGRPAVQSCASLPLQLGTVRI